MPSSPPTPHVVGPTTSGLAGTSLIEIAESGKYSLEFKQRWDQVFEGKYSDINSVVLTYARGALNGAGWVVSQTDVEKFKGGKGRFTIHWENIAGYLNPDEWDVEPEDLQPKIQRHPMFAALSSSDFGTIEQAVLAAQTSNTGVAYAPDWTHISDGNSALAQKLYDKLFRGQETYILYGARYTWSTYYLAGDEPALNNGSVTQTPGGPSGEILPSGFSWVRLADKIGTANNCPAGYVLRLTRAWQGAPNGFWDTDLYPAG